VGPGGNTPRFACTSSVRLTGCGRFLAKRIHEPRRPVRIGRPESCWSGGRRALRQGARSSKAPPVTPARLTHLCPCPRPTQLESFIRDTPVSREDRPAAARLGPNVRTVPRSTATATIKVKLSGRPRAKPQPEPSGANQSTSRHRRAHYRTTGPRDLEQTVAAHVVPGCRQPARAAPMRCGAFISRSVRPRGAACSPNSHGSALHSWATLRN